MSQGNDDGDRQQSTPYNLKAQVTVLPSTHDYVGKISISFFVPKVVGDDHRAELLDLITDDKIELALASIFANYFYHHTEYAGTVLTIGYG